MTSFGGAVGLGMAGDKEGCLLFLFRCFLHFRFDAVQRASAFGWMRMANIHPVSSNFICLEFYFFSVATCFVRKPTTNDRDQSSQVKVKCDPSNFHTDGKTLSNFQTDG